VQPKFQTRDATLILRCPKCGGEHLNHEGVEIFERGEDKAQGLHVSVGGGTISTDIDLTGNPSSRRHGLLIHYECEGCDAKPTLAIWQHKGETFFAFQP